MRSGWYMALTIVAFTAAISLIVAALVCGNFLYGLLGLGALAVSYYASGKANEHDDEP